jgi:predicted N-acetyltransferase YhbS
MPENAQPEVTIRRATPEDTAVCGAISYRAFSTINGEHNFPCDFPNQEVAVGATAMLFGHPGFYCVVAESDGRIIGGNCLDERAIIAGVGPITVDPDVQNRGAGRKLMQVVMDRANERGMPGIRLVQAAFHNRSMALYTRLGFDIREPLACLQGRPTQRAVAGCTVRPAQLADVEACDALSLKVHGFDRGGELADGIAQGSAVVVERDGRNTMLLRWCLSNGLHIVQPMTLMSIGLYNEPDGAWMPSVSF